MRENLDEIKCTVNEIDKIVRGYIVLAAPTKEIAEELLEWWDN